MNKLILLLASLILIITACTKRDQYRDDATILGFDNSTGTCQGGFQVKLANDDDKPYFRAKTLPTDAGINSNGTFPVNVEVDYQKVKGDCDDEITVSRVRLK